MEEEMMNRDNDFESKLNRLKKIVESLEEGDLSLEESLEYFEEGIKLYRSCNKVLNNAEQKITLLLTEKGEEEIPFINNGEE